MGKGKRHKLKRSENLQRAHLGTQEAPGKTRKAPLETLHQAFERVGQRFGTTTKCVEAAAMLFGIAKHLGYDLQLRPVSVGVTDRVSGKSVCMGPKILASLTQKQREALQGEQLSDGSNLGHVVLTLDTPALETPALLMDPNLRQVNRLGIDVPNVFAPIETASPEQGRWILNFERYEVTYMLDPGAMPLLKNFEEYSASEEEDYRNIANELWRGSSIELNSDQANV